MMRENTAKRLVFPNDRRDAAPFDGVASVASRRVASRFKNIASLRFHFFSALGPTRLVASRIVTNSSALDG